MQQFGLFVFGFFTLLSISAALAAGQFQLSRRVTVSRLVVCGVLLACAAVLAWFDYQGEITTAAAICAGAFAAFLNLMSFLVPRLQANLPLKKKGPL